MMYTRLVLILALPFFVPRSQHLALLDGVRLRIL